METVNLNASKRERVGSRYARRYRTAGRLPAVIYGHKQEPTPIVVDHKEAMTYLNHGVKLFQVDVDGAVETCLIKDLQFDHLGTNVVHLDFARIDLNEEVSVQVALRFLGEPVGLRQPGAIFRHIEEAVEVTCIATSIPDHVDIDVSGLGAGHHMTAADVALPEGVKLESEPAMMICRVDVVQEEEEAAPAPAEGAEPEIISGRAAEEKKAEE